MTTILTFIIPALIVVLLSLPLVNVFKGKVTAKSAKMRLGTHICGFFGAVALVLFLTYANSPVLAAGADKMTGSIAQGLGFIGVALATGLSALGAGIAVAAAAPAATCGSRRRTGGGTPQTARLQAVSFGTQPWRRCLHHYCGSGRCSRRTDSVGDA